MLYRIIYVEYESHYRTLLQAKSEKETEEEKGEQENVENIDHLSPFL